MPDEWSRWRLDEYYVQFVRYRGDEKQTLDGDYLNALETQAAKLAEVLRYFARWEHRRQFPHVRPSPAEQRADAVLAEYDAVR